MGAAAILNLVLAGIPQALQLYLQIRATLSEKDLAALDAELASADAQVTADNAAVQAAG